MLLTLNAHVAKSNPPFEIGLVLVTWELHIIIVVVVPGEFVTKQSSLTNPTA